MAVNVSKLKLNRLKMAFTHAPLADIPGTVTDEMQVIRPLIKKEMRIALAVGSRGIDHIALIVRETVKNLIDFGAKPFIVPAMGSHGGATAAGQKELLASYGITDEAMGVPVLSSMRVKNLGVLPDHHHVSLFMDEFSFHADGVFVVNRVKAHTDFHGPHESGIAKMLVIGLGKQEQALAIHEYQAAGLRELIPKAAQAVIDSGKIIGALAIVEDGYDRTSILKVVKAPEILAADAALLVKAKAMMPRLPFERLDVLLVDTMGKNISGTGMDTNVIGRTNIRGEADLLPHISRICLLDMTDQSHGNALGIGLADVITRSLYEKVNWAATYENVLTSRFVERGFIPIVRETDREAVETAVGTCGFRTAETLRLVRIRDTLHIDEMYVSDALLGEIRGNRGIEVLAHGIPLPFDEAGTLVKM